MQSAASADGRLRVVVVEDDEAIRLALIQTLRDTFGHEVVGEASTGPHMVEVVLRTEPDVVVFDIHLPGMDGLAALKHIGEQMAVAAVAITADRDLELVRRASEEQVLAFLIKPFEHFQLGPILQVARARFQEIQGLSSENQRLQQTLENRKLIERAKGVLMHRQGVDEEDAFRRLRSTASSKNLKLVEAARRLIAAEEVLSEFDGR